MNHADPLEGLQDMFLNNCGICGRSLLRESSVEMGIGPICAAKFGW